MRWQYGILNTSAPDALANLNEWGAEGWELVHVETEWGKRGAQTQTPVHCFMKRPIPTDSDEARWASDRP